MKKYVMRLLAVACLLPTLLLTACTDSPEDPASSAKVTTEGAEQLTPRLTVDSSYRIVIAAEAGDIVRKTADMVAATFLEKAGLSLEVVTDAQPAGEHEIILGVTNRMMTTADMGWNLSAMDGTLLIHSNDHIALYYAAEAILETWLTPEYGLTETGGVILAEEWLEEFNQLATKRDTSIKVMTQNMRGSSDPDGNSVQARSERFVRMVQEYGPDLIGTQEFSYSWEVWLHKRAEAMGLNEETSAYGMVGCYNSGPGNRQGGMNAILYRRDRFELLDSNTFWLSATPDVPSTVEGTRDKRICTWALLKDKMTGETILFANTHLDHTSNELRVAQAEILMEHLTAMFGDYPVYLTGDMNCYSDTPPYNILAEELLDSHREAWVDHSTIRHSFHDYGTRRGNLEIDFIFSNEQITPVQYEIISKDYDGFVSDHYGVIAEFVRDAE